MISFIKIYVLTLVIFLAIDSIWLIFIAKNMYESQIGWLMSKSPNLIAALIFYLIFVFGLVYFALWPAVNNGNWSLLILNAAIFGLMTYATYDLTSLAVVKNWPVVMSIIDIAWGIFISVVTAIIVYDLLRWLKWT